MDPSGTLLLVLAVAFVHLCFFLLTFQLEAEAKRYGAALAYFIAVAFFGALYFRRRRAGVYHGLGYAAVMLGALASALLFLAVGAAIPVPLAIGVWLGVAVAAYFFYRVIVLHLGEPTAVQAVRRAPV